MTTLPAKSILKLKLAFPVCVLLLSISASSAQTGGDLQKVLDRMDDAAAKFHSAQANFSWAQYNKVIDDITDTQKGKIYFRRAGKETQMAADILQPDAKLVIFSEGKIQIYQPRIDQVDVYDAGTHREEFESFLVLGFGGSGQDMLKSFEVTYQGEEKIDGVDAAKLDLTPKSGKIKQNFAHILLWINPQTGLSVQQKLFEASGDTRLAKYFDIQINQKIPDAEFKLKTSPRTKILTH